MQGNMVSISGLTAKAQYTPSVQWVN